MCIISVCSVMTQRTWENADATILKYLKGTVLRETVWNSQLSTCWDTPLPQLMKNVSSSVWVQGFKKHNFPSHADKNLPSLRATTKRNSRTHPQWRKVEFFSCWEENVGFLSELCVFIPAAAGLYWPPTVSLMGFILSQHGQLTLQNKCFSLYFYFNINMSTNTHKIIIRKILFATKPAQL